MKKILSILILVLLSLTDFAQNITSLQAKELFGKRFISADEAGFPDSLKIPFQENEIRYNIETWLVPILIDGVPQYRLIQARYSPNQYEKYDTLNLGDAEKVIGLLNKVRPNFPNEDTVKTSQKYFFRTKESAPSKEGIEFRKTISYFNDKLLVVSLPSNSITGTMDPQYIMYMVENKGRNLIGFEFLPDDAPKVTDQNITILTLVFLTR